MKKLEVIENVDKNTNSMQKTANFGGNNVFNNKINTPKKNTTIDSQNHTNSIKKDQTQLFSSDQKIVTDSAKKNLDRGMQRGYLLYTKAIEKQKMR